MKTAQLEVLIEATASIGEGPCWHQEKQLFYWVDIYGKTVNIYHPETKTNSAIQLREMVGCVVPRKSGGLVIALKNGIAGLDIEKQAMTYLLKLEEEFPSNRFNDGKCDPMGRFLAGTMEVNSISHKGSLYSIDKNLSVKKLLENLTISNGMGWSPDHSIFYFIDSPTMQVVAFDYDLRTGAIDNRRIVVTIPENSGGPDGMTVDNEGMLWIALWGGSCVSRWNPQTGKLLRTFAVPAPSVSSCTFGGPDLNELYITTARYGLSKTQLDKYPLSGSVFRLKTNTVGMETFQFAG